MKTNCKPCITIRTILKLLYKNYIIEATRRFKADYESYKMIGAVECVLPSVPPPKATKNVVKVRELAKERFDPIINDLVKESISKRRAKEFDEAIAKRKTAI